MQADHQAMRMKQGQWQQEDVIRLPRPGAQQSGYRGQHIVVAEDRPFAGAGGAACVHEQGRLFAAGQQRRWLRQVVRLAGGERQPARYAPDRPTAP